MHGWVYSLLDGRVRDLGMDVATRATNCDRPTTPRSRGCSRHASETTRMSDVDPGQRSAPKPVGAYPHARRVGDLLFLSGIGPRDPATNAIAGNEYFADGRLRRVRHRRAGRAVFANVRAVLEASGARWEDLVDVTVYLTDMARDFKAYNAVWAEYFPDAGDRALPHDARHHRAADADRDRTQVRRRAPRRPRQD